MPVSMTGKSEQVEVITSVQRRRRWAAEEKVAVVGDVCAGDVGVAGGAAASEYRALQHQVREDKRRSMNFSEGVQMI
jgi:hypothetical protein